LAQVRHKSQAKAWYPPILVEIQLVALLKSLNEQDAVTIVVVTHDLDVAKEAKRQIRLKDGKVIADEAVAPVAVA
jgi:energy-coupling factor transporter ATP-binding protein EcfA2